MYLDFLFFICINSIVKFPYLSIYLLNIYPKNYLPNLNSILGTPTLYQLLLLIEEESDMAVHIVCHIILFFFAWSKIHFNFLQCS